LQKKFHDFERHLIKYAMDLVLEIICNVAWGLKKDPWSNWVLLYME
jgi:hypothetical protein